MAISATVKWLLFGRKVNQLSGPNNSFPIGNFSSKVTTFTIRESDPKLLVLLSTAVYYQE